MRAAGRAGQGGQGRAGRAGRAAGRRAAGRQAGSRQGRQGINGGAAQLVCLLLPAARTLIAVQCSAVQCSVEGDRSLTRHRGVVVGQAALQPAAGHEGLPHVDAPVLWQRQQCRLRWRGGNGFMGRAGHTALVVPHTTTTPHHTTPHHTTPHHTTPPTPLHPLHPPAGSAGGRRRPA